MQATTKISRTIDSEYRVRLFIDGVYQAGCDYFTDCITDANATAVLMRAKATPSDKTTEFAQNEFRAFLAGQP